MSNIPSEPLRKIFDTLRRIFHILRPLSAAQISIISGKVTKIYLQNGNSEDKAREERNFKEYSGNALYEILPKRLLAVSIIGFVKILLGRKLSGKIPARKGRRAYNTGGLFVSAMGKKHKVPSTIRTRYSKLISIFMRSFDFLGNSLSIVSCVKF